MTETNLPARRTAAAVAATPTPRAMPIQPLRRRITFVQLLAIAAILAFVAGVMTNLTTT